MTTEQRPAAVARVLTGAGTAIALIGMVTAFQLSAALEQQTAAATASSAPDAAHVRGLAVRVLDPSLLPEPVVVVAPATAPVAVQSRSGASAAAGAPAAPAAPAPAPAAPAPAPPADGSTAGSGG